MALETATLAGGCFWCLEAVYDQVKGVKDVVSGYTGGHVANPTYERVCSGKTGHAEAVQITFDPEQISYRELLEIFFSIHDPTTLNRQGADVGTQYRSAIFYHSEEQRQIAEQLVRELTEQKVFRDPIVDRDRTGYDILPCRRLPPRVLCAEPLSALLSVCGGAKGSEISKTVCASGRKRT